jgi:serine phosphatase RsbU (regulator of sigma subunit)
MGRSLKLLPKALISDAALAALYDMRKAQRPAEENRTRVAMFACGLLFLACMGFLLSMAWSRHDLDSWLSKRPNIVPIDASAAPWTATPVVRKDCESGAACLAAAQQLEAKAVEPQAYKLQLPAGMAGSDHATSLWRTVIPVATMAKMQGLNTQTNVVSLPSFSYRRADLYVDGAFQHTSWDGGRLWFAYDPKVTGAQPLQVAILFEIGGEQTHLSRAGLPKVNPLDRASAVMPLSEWRAFEEFVASDKAGRGDFIGAIARIAMAVFVLMLFLLIDGSPETLGLGLFLGFEAFAISCSFGWLPFGNVEWLRHYCYQMGDIFRVYFFLQIARVVDKRIMPWLIWGSVASIIYGVLRQIGPQYDLTWLYKIPHARDFTAGLIGLVVCVRTGVYLRNKGLNYRVLALAIAAVGAFEQFLEPATVYIPALRDSMVVQTLMDVLQPIGAWMLAFSAFINISTLENRVKMLSGIEAKAKEMQNEMELGRAVQQAFLSLPKLPDEMRVACHHEAMLYVSGDTYFVDWNERHKKLTFLINDVTGHGVQAALKASGVSVIANTIWADKVNPTWRPGKLAEYGEMVAEFFGRMDANPDVLAMGGAEFDPTTGKLSLYRVNFPFPIIISPKRDHLAGEESRKSDNWRIQILPITSGEETEIQLTDGAFVVLTSDGFIDHSRRTNEFLKHMRKHLGAAPASLSAEEIKTIILSCSALADRTDDDKTLTIFQWQRNLESIPSRPPRAA